MRSLEFLTTLKINLLDWNELHTLISLQVSRYVFLQHIKAMERELGTHTKHYLRGNLYEVSENHESNSGHSSVGQPSAAPTMQNMWWTDRHWWRFSVRISVSPTNSHSTDCSIFISNLKNNNSHLGTISIHQLQQKYFPPGCNYIGHCSFCNHEFSDTGTSPFFARLMIVLNPVSLEYWICNLRARLIQLFHKYIIL
jgi:hypothetical protein